MEESQEVAKVVVCKDCDYSTSRSNDFKKHLLTSKHLNRIKAKRLEENIAESQTLFTCTVCDKQFRARNTLWYHQQKCKPATTTSTPTFTNDHFIVALLQQNAQLIQQNGEFLSVIKSLATKDASL